MSGKLSQQRVVDFRIGQIPRNSQSPGDRWATTPGDVAMGMNTTTLSTDDRLSAEKLTAHVVARQPAGGRSLPIRLENISGGRHDNGMLCGMMLHKFAARSVDQMAALVRALDSGNARELARGAGALKGVAAELAAEVLLERADELERSARCGDLETAALALVRTREEMERCAAAASELLGQLLDEHSLG